MPYDEQWEILRAIVEGIPRFGLTQAVFEPRALKLGSLHVAPHGLRVEPELGHDALLGSRFTEPIGTTTGTKPFTRAD